MKAGITLLLILLSTTSCSASTDRATQADTPTEARQRWARHAPAEYRLIVSQACYCLEQHQQPVWIDIEGETLREVLLKNDSIIPEEMEHLLKTIPQWFGYIEAAQEQNWAKVEVDYHPKLGYPTEIHIDKNERIADDEITIHIQFKRQ